MEQTTKDVEVKEDNLSDEELDTMLEELCDALEMLDYLRAEEQVKQILSHKLQERIRLNIYRIRDDINDFEFEKALDRTRTLLG
jgi:hypothetical protein